VSACGGQPGGRVGFEDCGPPGAFCGAVASEEPGGPGVAVLGARIFAVERLADDRRDVEPAVGELLLEAT